ncbi:hypothetical protein EZV62_002498 [Acer yangbiense]|uniref:HMA domain-containing protein n=1 Tax=Acer yangbiense TaxID=1000413 RepID=A0A5C7IXS7_9ROSI|nr:hypothetical protein EZV62_002498 [Acer yangbiense]
MAEKKKVTLMLLKVNLERSKCYKKVKKILCKFPHVYVFGVFVNKTKEIQDQVYDEKNNTVRIKVVCCSPEKIRDKICCKGRGIIKCIVIVIPEEKKPPPPEEKKPPPPPPEVKKPPAPWPMKDDPNISSTSTDDGPGPTTDPPETRPAINTTKGANYVNVTKPPAPGPVPIGFCCTECSEGRGRGPCYNACYGQPVRYYDGYCGRPVYDSWGGGGYRGNYGSRCSEYYFNEDNSQGCTIM